MPYTDKQRDAQREVMGQGEPLPVELVTRAGERSRGEFRLWRLSEADRQKRALKWLLSCVGLGVVGIIGPPHGLWLLVGIIVGVVGYFARGKEQQRLLGGEALCPKCKQAQFLDAAALEFPLLHFCTECSVRCVVDRVADNVAA